MTDEPFGPLVAISIDGQKIEAPAGALVLNVAQRAGVYIPSLCSHPGQLPAAQPTAGNTGCNLCLVEIEGRPGFQKACSLQVEEGLSIRAGSPEIKDARRSNLAKILGNHPHVCLTCPQRDGCSRTECSYGNPVETRCCSIFASCELRKVSDYIGIPNTTPMYRPAQLPVIKDEPFYTRDYNLCIDCRRCLVACNDIRGVGCLEVKESNGRFWVGTIESTLVESGCKFCSACVAVCPTGALLDRTLDPARREESMVPCKAACPAGINVPLYVQLAAEGKYGEAVAVVREKLPFPGILGRACAARCEPACRRAMLDDPLSIRTLKRVADDNDTGLWRKQSKRLPPTGRKAAVIGAGLAGLTVASYLAKKGHAVTVFDVLPAAGGMARYGVPSYRIPSGVIDREVGEVEKLGVEFRYSTKVENLDDLFGQGYEAVFIGVGCQRGKMGVPGGVPGAIDSAAYMRAASINTRYLQRIEQVRNNRYNSEEANNTVGQQPRKLERFGVQADAKGRIIVGEGSMLTSRPGVYAGGDVVLGPATMIEAVAQGRIAASAMDRQLGGSGDIEEKLLPAEWEANPRIGREEGFNRRRKVPPVMCKPFEGEGWDEEEKGYGDAMARAEAGRCLKCDLAVKIHDATLPPESWLEFNEATVSGITEGPGVIQLLDADKNVLMIKGVENLRAGISGHLWKNEKARYFVFEEAAMYTSRESQMIQDYLQQYGKMPGGGSSELDELF